MFNLVILQKKFDHNAIFLPSLRILLSDTVVAGCAIC